MNLYPALTSLRFVAALLVFLFHFPPEGPVWSVVAGEGHVGVNIFFVLSGFLIALRYGEGFARGEIRLADYFLRRAARILPLYYAVLFLSLGLARFEPVSWAALWPELTLTQALFGESVNHLVIPTSWSLTVEECFYASAPAVLFAMAALRRRAPGRPLLAPALVLTLATVVLFAAGALIWTLLDGRGPGFLRSPDQVVRHTIFGRFYDFAIGAFAAAGFARGSWRGLVDRGRSAALATLVAVVLIVASQWGMSRAGGIDGPHWAQAWSWSALLAPATALLIVALTARGNPAARALGQPVLVYLGKISYALYLVQLTPLGKGLFYRVTPHYGLFTLLFLYAGMTLVSAALYELVEEPARKLILRLAGLERDSPAPAPSASLARPAGALALGLALAVQGVSWGVVALDRRLGPVTLDELRAAGLRETDFHEVLDARWGREVVLAGVPRRWREGWRHDLRAPSGIHVFVEGESVAFSRREPAGPGRAAFFRGPRAEHLALRVDRVPAGVVLVRQWPLTEARVRLSRWWRSPADALAVGALLALCAGLAGVVAGAFTPRVAVGLALAMVLGWILLDLREERWGLAVMALEGLALIAFARRGAPRVASATAEAINRS